MVAVIARQVPAWFSELGYRFLGESAPPDSVSVRRDHTALIASLVFRHGERRVVIKALPKVESFCHPEEFCEAHENLAALSPRIAASTPRILAFNREHEFFVMEYVPGTTLQEHLVGGWGLVRERPENSSLVYRAGEVLAEIHRVTPADLGMACAPRKNATFLRSLEEHWREAGPLPQAYREPGRLLDRLSPAFFERLGDRLHVLDSQPKNVLVSAPNRLCMIDPAYCWLNPALGVGYFLLGLDRIGIRFPLSDRRVRGWKRQFLSGYFSQPAPAFAEDLIFFYPWALLAIQRLHLDSRPRWYRYLRRNYARALTGFLLNLERLSLEEIEQCPAALFDR